MNLKKTVEGTESQTLTPEQQIEQLKNIATNLAKRCASLENTWLLSRVSMFNEIVKCDFYDNDFRKQCAKELQEFLFPKEESK